MNPIEFEGKTSGISVADAKKLLNKNGNEYTDEEVKKIMKHLLKAYMNT
jgi:cytochrome c-type biogenesis protein CcmE